MTEHHSHIQSSRHSIKVQTIEATIANLAPKLGLCRCLHRSLCLARALVICVVVAALHLDRLKPAGDLRLRGQPSAEEAPAAAGAEEEWVAAAVGRKKESIFVREAVSDVVRAARSRCFRFFSPATPLPRASSSSESSSSSTAASCSYSDSAQDTRISESGGAITRPGGAGQQKPHLDRLGDLLGAPG